MTTSSQPSSEFDIWKTVRKNTITLPDQGLYADWTASGRLYRPIEERLSNFVGAMMANTHTEDSASGSQMTYWLHEAQAQIKQHVNASSSDALLSVGSGMTGALAKLIRILGLWAHESHRSILRQQKSTWPLVYITHREHHSNHTMWLESLAEVRIIPPLADDEIDLQWLKEDLEKESKRPLLIASVTAASNVTGIHTPYWEIARLMHDRDGFCFVDFAAAAPYVNINMHPSANDWLDAIFFSPHKFLGGPGSEGIVVFNQRLYQNQVPDQPGGGTVIWTNPWGEHRFIADIEKRESGGTPGILQTIKTALCIQLKNEMGVARMAMQEQMLNDHFFKRLEKTKDLRVLSSHKRDRLSIFSVLFENISYRKAVQLLSYEFGIETRGGCACAGTYGHYLLNINHATSRKITQQLDDKNYQAKPGWVRISLHPSMTKTEVDVIADALNHLAEHGASMKVNKYRPDSSLWQPLSRPLGVLTNT